MLRYFFVFTGGDSINRKLYGPCSAALIVSLRGLWLQSISLPDNRPDAVVSKKRTVTTRFVHGLPIAVGSNFIKSYTAFPS